MKRYLFFAIACSFLSVSLLGQTTPNPVSMSGSISNANAFGVEGTLGFHNSVTYYLHWDANYIYFGFDGGNNWDNQDLYFVAIDTEDNAGTSSGIYGLNFSNSVFDYYAVFENHYCIYGPLDFNNGCTLTPDYSHTNPNNGIELWDVEGGDWDMVYRITANDEMDSRIIYNNMGGEVRYRVLWSDLGVTPGANQGIAVSYWMNNGSLSNIWSVFPTNNSTGAVNQTMTKKLKFSSTGSGVNPSTAGTEVDLAVSLPIELINFSVTAFQTNTFIQWNTVSEYKSSHFEIEHSTDGILFESLGRLETAGESSVLQYYNFEHTEPVSGSNYYRLAHYDLDGTLSYSDIRAVDLSKNISIKVFPNPVKDILTISSVEDFNLESIEIYDMQGVLVETLNTLGDRNDIELSTNDWKVGIYQVVLLQSDGTVSVQNIIKQ